MPSFFFQEMFLIQHLRTPVCTHPGKQSNPEIYIYINSRDKIYIDIRWKSLFNICVQYNRHLHDIVFFILD